jgi:hypothetical protein
MDDRQKPPASAGEESSRRDDLPPEAARLGSPPRPVGPSIWMTYALLGSPSGWTPLVPGLVLLAVFGAYALIHFRFFDPVESLTWWVMVGAWLLVTGVLALLQLDEERSRHIRLLREGLVAPGTLVDHEERVSGETLREQEAQRSHHYTFRFRARDGSHYTFEHREDARPREELSDDEIEPILYIPDEDGSPVTQIPLDALGHVRIGESGRPRVSRSAWFKLAVLAAITIFGLLAIVSRGPLFG